MGQIKANLKHKSTSTCSTTSRTPKKSSSSDTLSHTCSESLTSKPSKPTFPNCPHSNVSKSHSVWLCKNFSKQSTALTKPLKGKEKFSRLITWHFCPRKELPWTCLQSMPNPMKNCLHNWPKPTETCIILLITLLQSKFCTSCWKSLPFSSSLQKRCYFCKKYNDSSSLEFLSSRYWENS